jgi:hypothetical protein
LLAPQKVPLFSYTIGGREVKECTRKVAAMLAMNGEYAEASHMFQRVRKALPCFPFFLVLSFPSTRPVLTVQLPSQMGVDAMESAATRYTARDMFLRAGMCMLANGVRLRAVRRLFFRG